MGFSYQKYFSSKIYLLFLACVLIFITSANSLRLKVEQPMQPSPVLNLYSSGVSRSSSGGKTGLNLNFGSGQTENNHSASSLLSNLNNWANSANLGNTFVKLTGNGQSEGSTTGTNESILGHGLSGGSSTHGGLLSALMNSGTGEGTMRTSSGTVVGSGPNEGSETSGAAGNFQINGPGRGDVATRGDGNLFVNGLGGQSKNTVSSAGLLNMNGGSGSLTTGMENAANLNIGNIRGSSGTSGSSSLNISGNGTGYTETTGTNEVNIRNYSDLPCPVPKIPNEDINAPMPPETTLKKDTPPSNEQITGENTNEC